MQPTIELIDDIYRERVLRARQTPGADKMRAGPELFDFACRITMDGIRHQNPGADEATVRAILHKRLELGRWLENYR
jgi:hypothetical protein